MVHADEYNNILDMLVKARLQAARSDWEQKAPSPPPRVSLLG